jgi:hypothetical protein
MVCAIASSAAPCGSCIVPDSGAVTRQPGSRQIGCGRRCGVSPREETRERRTPPAPTGRRQTSGGGRSNEAAPQPLPPPPLPARLCSSAPLPRRALEGRRHAAFGHLQLSGAPVTAPPPHGSLSLSLCVCVEREGATWRRAERLLVPPAGAVTTLSERVAHAQRRGAAAALASAPLLLRVMAGSLGDGERGELLRHRGMNAYRVVEILLGRTHLHGHGVTLPPPRTR